MEAAVGIETAVAALADGEIVGVPTDTVYGLAVDPFQPDAVGRLFDLKGRPDERPLALLVADLDQALELASFSDRALELAERYWPGALTLVLPRLGSVPEWLGDPRRRTVGLRCPDHPIALELLRAAGPLVVTSANPSGEPPALADGEARAYFGHAVALYLPGRAPGGAPSTVLDLTRPTELVLRPGPVVP